MSDNATARISVKATIYEDALFFRTTLADGEVESEGKTYKIEAATNMNGDSILLSIQGANGPRRTYALSTKRLLRAMVEHHLKSVDAAKDGEPSTET